MDNNILVIGIAGGSASGKTTLMKNLIADFEDEVTVLSHDNYYKRHDELSYEERSRLNYDEPDAFDTSLMVYHLEPRRVIIVEGILIFENEELRNLMDIRIFVDSDADIRLCRRIKRDVNKRGRSLESVLNQYQETVKPMHERYVEPSKKFAHLVVPEGGKNMVALDMIVSRIRRYFGQPDL